MPLSIPAPPSTTPISNKLDQASIRATRKRIFELVRNDFTYLPPASTSTTITQSPPPLQAIESDRVKTWEEYRYASSDPSSEENDEDEENVMLKAALELEHEQRQRLQQQQQSGGEGLGNKIRRKRRSLLNHIIPTDKGSSGSAPASPSSPKFSSRSSQEQDESDDADDESEKSRREEEAAQAQKKAERKYRRRRRLEEEKTWNPGLEFWARRRDAWCCARTVDAADPQKADGGDGQQAEAGQEEARSMDQSTNTIPQAAPSSMSPGVEKPGDTQHLQVEPPILPTTYPPRPDTPSSHPSTAARTSSPTSSATALTSPDYSDTNLPRRPSGSHQIVQIPVTKPILPANDPSRSQTHNTRAFGAIYSKVVVQGLTPTVPINLKTMTSALVQGWKQDGEWPMQTAVADTSMRLNASALRNQESVMGKSVRRGKEKLRERKAARRPVG